MILNKNPPPPPQDGEGGGKSKAPRTPASAAPRFSSDLFVRRVHLLVGEVLEPVWRDPRLASLPQEAASRLLAAVLELLQSLQVSIVGGETGARSLIFYFGILLLCHMQ